MVFTDLVVICAFLSRFYFDTKLANLHDEIKESQAIIEATSTFEESFRSLQKRLSLIKTLSAAKIEGEKKISFLAQILPSDVTLANVSFTKDKADLSGTAGSETGMATFIKNLLLVPQIKTVNISHLSIKDKSQGGLINFSLSTTWKSL